MKHIAIMRQPFFDMVLNGNKTIESRWSMNKIAPFNKVKVCDEILFKLTGHYVTAKAKVKAVRYYELTPSIADEINKLYGKEIGIDKFTNWQEVRRKRYCTLIWLDGVQKIKPMSVPRSNGAGWLVLN